MENSFFRSPWYSPNPNSIRHGQFPQERPKRSPNPNLHAHFPEERPLKPKVVSVPIHFGESVAESKRKSSAAVKIQKVFRGFLVRKNFKTVRKIEREIDEIQRRIERDADLIWRERKEWIRINELLMAVLFRLDSVRGVRDYRKMVIRRAISLQEALDSFSSEVIDRQTLGNQDQEPNPQSKAEEEVKIASPEKDRETLENPQSNGEEEEVKIASCEEEEALEDQETLETSESGADEEEVKKDIFPEESMEDQEPKPDGEETMDDDQETIVKDIGVDEKATPMEGEEEEEEGWSIVETLEAKAPKPEKVEQIEAKEEKSENDSEGMKEVMERMVAENKQLKELVAVLCERSAHQCCLMGGLAKRMEQLEKTVETMERKRKKKKREAKNGQ